MSPQAPLYLLLCLRAQPTAKLADLARLQYIRPFDRAVCPADSNGMAQIIERGPLWQCSEAQMIITVTMQGDMKNVCLHAKAEWLLSGVCLRIFRF